MIAEAIELTLNLKLDPSGKRIIGKGSADRHLLSKISGKVFIHAKGSDYSNLLLLAGNSNCLVVMEQSDVEKFF